MATFMALLGIVGMLRGGLEASQKQCQIDQQTAETIKKTNDFVKQSQELYDNYEQKDDDYKEKITLLQEDMASQSTKLLVAKRDFSSFYLKMQIFVVFVIILVAVLLLSKKLGVLTLNPFKYINDNKNN